MHILESSQNLSFQALDQESSENIHIASLEILEHTGMEVGSEKILAIAQDRGLNCIGNRIRFTPEQIEVALAKTGRKFKLLARNTEHSLNFSRGTSFIGMGRSAPFIGMPGGKRRNPTAADYIEFMKLGQMLHAIDLPGQLVYPGDIKTGRVYRYMMVQQILHTDKPFCLLHEKDIELLCLAFDIDFDTLAAGPDTQTAWAQTTINTQSPLTLTRDQGNYLLTMARAGIPVCISPSPAAGSTGPCSIVGNLVLNNVEILGILALAQLIRPGLPVLYSTFPSASDMRSMMATYGGPDTRRMETGAAAMADYYRLLTRGNVCISDAQDIDYQTGAESLFNLLTAMHNQVTYLPGCGITGGFGMASREKLLLDAELVTAVRYYYEPLNCDSLKEIVALIKEIGPKGNFVAHPHTFTSFKKELFHTDLFSRVSNDRWLNRNKSLTELASAHADKMLLDYEHPSLEPLLKKHLNRKLCSN